MSESRVRILYVNPIAIMGGAETSLLELVSGLDKDNYQPILLTPEPGIVTELFEQKGFDTIFLSSIPVPGKPVSNTYQSFLFNSYKIARIIRQMDVKIVHSNSPRAAYHGGLAGRWAGVPTVTHVRDCHATPFQSLAKSLFLDAISDRLVCVSRAAKNAVTERLPALRRKTFVIYNGITPSPSMGFEEIQELKMGIGISGRYPLLAVIGAISELKGQQIVLQAMPEILRKFPQACLLVVGETLGEFGRDYRQKLISMVRELSLENSVIFTGLRRDIPRIMASVDLLVHVPVLPDAFPRVLLEAGALGLPVVASDTGGIGEIVRDGVTGRLVPPANADRLASTVNEVLSDRENLTRMSVASREHVRFNFSMENYVNSVQSVYQQLLHR